jgi:hypothetical protein
VRLPRKIGTLTYEYGYRFYCIRCTRRRQLKNRLEDMQQWPIRLGHLGIFSQVCDICTRNINPESRISDNLFYEMYETRNDGFRLRSSLPSPEQIRRN